MSCIIFFVLKLPREQYYRPLGRAIKFYYFLLARVNNENSKLVKSLADEKNNSTCLY